jgi:hypothetical protein
MPAGVGSFSNPFITLAGDPGLRGRADSGQVKAPAVCAGETILRATLITPKYSEFEKCDFHANLFQSNDLL